MARNHMVQSLRKIQTHFSVFDVHLLDNDVSTNMNNYCMNSMKTVLSEEFHNTHTNKVLVVLWRIFDIHAFPLHKKLLVEKKGSLEYSNIIHTKKKMFHFHFPLSYFVEP